MESIEDNKTITLSMTVTEGGLTYEKTVFLTHVGDGQWENMADGQILTTSEMRALLVSFLEGAGIWKVPEAKK